ncbi:OLC1v1011126C1 [Oldenlandia corymbosa var. corymbosa]|uniref:OLC1v1011126C1 n=1 Tax=Oldenlandia corymbosa var. corymbosa TaxID=529605 RepID=A0AAV1DVQ3_OLDCO|nr:OLC1v1011126C1 [Oldenlandia corymbosa var. corymbosa]
MKSVVATSLLAKSWSLRWKGVGSIDIESRWWTYSGDFVDFVNNMFEVLKRYTIHKFRLKWENVVFGSPWLIEWLALAVCRKVRVVDVGVFSEDGKERHFVEFGVKLPGKLFSCKTLEILKLRGPFIINLPPRVAVCLPKLVHLELSLVHFKDEQKSLPKLVQGCPVLQSFRFDRKFWYNSCSVINWSISSPSLKHLDISLGDDGGGHLFEIGNGRNCKLEIDAPALEKLVLTDGLLGEILIRGGSINEVDLDFISFGRATDTYYQSLIVRLIQGLNHVKLLKLSERTMEVLGRAASELSTTSLWSTRSLWPTTSFERLTKLVVKLH